MKQCWAWQPLSWLVQYSEDGDQEKYNQEESVNKYDSGKVDLAKEHGIIYI